MTIRDLVILAGHYRAALIGYWLALPVLALGLSWTHATRQGHRGLQKYLYAALVYAACVPGMLVAVLTAYTLFLTRETLLDVDLAVYLLPIAGMVSTLLLIRRAADVDALPGFGRIQGLMVLLGVSFGIVLAIAKTHIGIVFFGSLAQLGVAALAVFAVLRWGSQLLFRKSDEPKPTVRWPWR